MVNILEKIVSQKKNDLLNIKKKYSNTKINELIKSNNCYFDFKDKLSNNIKQNKISVIAEIKKASPSAGILVKNYDPIKIAKNYLNIDRRKVFLG